MATKDDLRGWVVEALHAMGGSGRPVGVCREVWQRHEDDLRRSGDLFYTWQYDIRSAAPALRNEGRLKPLHGRAGPWELA